MKKLKIRFSIFLIILMFFASCTIEESSNWDTAEIHKQESQQEGLQTTTVEATETKAREFIREEYQEIAILTSDGQELDGVFYPASSLNSPLVILLHWAPGDQTDWREIAFWLQNRGLGGEEEANMEPWLDPSWFPEIDENWSFNVLVFNFRGCSGGCSSFNREGWLVDAKSAAEYGFDLEGIDRGQIIMVGASIGADGAADACLHINTIHPGSCKGSFSISPGNYLMLEFQSVVSNLGSVPVWCLYAESDPESARVCGDFNAANFRAVSYGFNEVRGNGHGMNLVEPDLEPNPLELLRDFLSEIVE